MDRQSRLGTLSRRLRRKAPVEQKPCNAECQMHRELLRQIVNACNGDEKCIQAALKAQNVR